MVRTWPCPVEAAISIAGAPAFASFSKNATVRSSFSERRGSSPVVGSKQATVAAG
jgi:hypothetical protein